MISQSKLEEQSKQYYLNINYEFWEIKQKIKMVLKQEDDLREVVQMAGYECLSEENKLILKIGQLIREDFLQQNLFSEYDFISPIEKTFGMMKCIIFYYEQACFCIKQKLKLENVLEQTTKCFDKLYDMKFLNPKTQKKQIIEFSINLVSEIQEQFDQIQYN
eukprot:TRINITY_DN1705_c0_g1_i2.p3 TRINITY_DN1705_c0_g1~~TRINITY_DN1705_c0_g1_i2.p3  ORF type:complete len:162 (-),score=34.11 TRINITY_DN1705_c0_g1_i2:70-555(-)